SRIGSQTTHLPAFHRGAPDSAGAGGQGRIRVSEPRALSCCCDAWRQREKKQAPAVSGRRPSILAEVGQPWISVAPAAVQASALDCSTKPWPLQAFWPLQALLAVLQALWPLQALMPWHFTLSALAGALVKPTAPPNNMAAAVAASVAPVIFRIDVMELPPELRFGLSQLPETVAFPSAGTKSPLCENVKRPRVARPKDGRYVEATPDQDSKFH